MIIVPPIVAAWRIVYTLCLFRVLPRHVCYDLVDDIAESQIFMVRPCST